MLSACGSHHVTVPLVLAAQARQLNGVGVQCIVVNQSLSLADIVTDVAGVKVYS